MKINRTSALRGLRITSLALMAVPVIFSCRKDGNPNNLPSVDPADYAGTIDGYTKTEEVYPNNLIAYWSFDDTKAETISNTAPGSSANDVFVTGGVRGKALQLTAGYLYFPTQFVKFRTDSLKSWTISAWVKILNNGSKRTMLFQLARPASLTGNINFALNTQSFPATTTNTRPPTAARRPTTTTRALVRPPSATRWTTTANVTMLWPPDAARRPRTAEGNGRAGHMG